MILSTRGTPVFLCILFAELRVSKGVASDPGPSQGSRIVFVSRDGCESYSGWSSTKVGFCISTWRIWYATVRFTSPNPTCVFV